MFYRIIGALPKGERQRFGRDLRTVWDKIITGDEQREFKITTHDLQRLVVTGNFTVPKSLIIPSK